MTYVTDLFQQYCVSLGGHLASVHSSEEYSFIQSLVGNSQAWLGATDVAQVGVWVWTDGSAFDYINWNSGEPNGGTNENCLMMNYIQVNWNDFPCEGYPCSSVCAND
ncbi:hypothetical protein NFI96_013867 [Prochilodus magdalenae]|nr:hypothetical protein NFI96_013867 [Prochilodus magdalenae]